MKKETGEMKIVVVMPAYCAAATIGDVIGRVSKKDMERIYEIIIVNDGSTDNTKEVALRTQKKYGKIKIIDHEVNKGYGAAQKTGYKEALKDGADIIILLHSDGQYAPEIMLDLTKPIEEGGADVVLGSRMLIRGGAMKGGMPLYKFIGNKFLTFCENLAYGLKLSEYHSGYMLYSRKALTTIPFEKLSNTFHFDGEMLIVTGKKGLRLAEMPIPTRYAGEKSHLNPIKYGLDVFRVIFRNFLGKYNF